MKQSATECEQVENLCPYAYLRLCSLCLKKSLKTSILTP